MNVNIPVILKNKYFCIHNIESPSCKFIEYCVFTEFVVVRQMDLVLCQYINNYSGSILNPTIHSELIFGVDDIMK